MAEYQVPPWIQAADPSQHFARGAQIGMEQQRLTQQAQQTQMELEQRKQEKERQYLMEQQQMEIGKQYHQMQMSLAQQKLEEAKAMNAEKIKAAALQGQAKMGYDQRIKAIQSDPSMSPEQKQQAWHQAAMEFGPGMAGTGNLGSLFGALNKMGAPEQSPMPRLDPASGALVDAKGVPHWKPGSIASSPEKALDMDEYKKLQASNIRLKTTLAETKDKGIMESLQAEIAQNVRRQRQLQQSLGMIPPTTQTATAATAQAPQESGAAPSIAGRYVDGKLIMTPKPDKGKVTIGGPSAAAAPAEPQGPAPGGLSIGGMSIGGAPTSTESQPQATIPASVQPRAPQPSEWDLTAQDVHYTPQAMPKNNDAALLAKIGNFLSGRDEEGKTIAEREAEERERKREQEEENQ